MPTNIKISVSVFVTLVGMGAFVFEQQCGDSIVGVVAILLAVIMILSIWIFPETKGTDNDNKGGYHAGEDR